MVVYSEPSFWGLEEDSFPLLYTRATRPLKYHSPFLREFPYHRESALAQVKVRCYPIFHTAECTGTWVFSLCANLDFLNEELLTD